MAENFDKDHTEACVLEGEDVLDEKGTQKLFGNRRNHRGKRSPPLMEEDWVVLCYTLYHSTEEEEWSDLHESLKEVCKKMGVKKDGQRIAELGRLGMAHIRQGTFFSPKKRLASCLQQDVRTSRGPLRGLECV